MNPLIVVAVHKGFKEFSKASRAKYESDKIGETYIRNL